MNQKGIFDVTRKSIYWMIAGIVITLVVLGFMMTLSSYKSKLISLPEGLRGEFIALRFTNIGECFAYQNEGQTESGTIDLSKFNIEGMQRCYPVTEDEPVSAVRLTLKNKNINSEDIIVQSANFKGGSTYDLKKRVKVYSDNDIYLTDLLIEVYNG